MDVGCERKRGAKRYSTEFGLRKWMELSFTELERS